LFNVFSKILVYGETSDFAVVYATLYSQLSYINDYCHRGDRAFVLRPGIDPFFERLEDKDFIEMCNVFLTNVAKILNEANIDELEMLAEIIKEYEFEKLYNDLNALENDKPMPEIKIAKDNIVPFPGNKNL
jgi:hypothetical protein